HERGEEGLVRERVAPARSIGIAPNSIRRHRSRGPRLLAHPPPDELCARPRACRCRGTDRASSAPFCPDLTQSAYRLRCGGELLQHEAPVVEVEHDLGQVLAV